MNMQQTLKGHTKGIEKTLNLCYFFYCVKLCAAGLHVCCPHTARLLPSHGTSAALTRHVCCPDTARLLPSHGTFAAHTRHVCCPDTARLLPRHGTFAAPTPLRDCPCPRAATAPFLFPHSRVPLPHHAYSLKGACRHFIFLW